MTKIRRDYGSLDIDAAQRVAFVRDAERCLIELGRQLQAEGLIGPPRIVLTNAKTAGFAGRLMGTYTSTDRDRSVSVVFSHSPDETLTRADGIAGYALYRQYQTAADGESVDRESRAGVRIPLKASYPEALHELVVRLLTSGPPVSRASDAAATGNS